MINKIYTAEDIKLIKPKTKVCDDVDISQKGFEKNLVESSQCALEFARSLVVNELPDKIQYVVYLGASFDGNVEDDEQIFPEDYIERTRCFFDSSEVVSLLWREGKVPEWINVSVESEDGKTTSVRLDCCGRYSNVVAKIYHAPEGRAPFHVFGPSAPPEYGVGEEGIRFDLYWNKTR